MEKVWDKQCAAYVETPAEMQAFLVDLEAVCRKHNLCVGHEDMQGGFDIRKLTAEDLQRLMAAAKNYHQED